MSAQRPKTNPGPRMQKPQRKSLRLQEYNYSQSGHYFITICTQDRACLFGEIIDHKMKLNQRGSIVREEWIKTGEVRENIRLDVFVVMPNHFHGIIIIENGRGTACRAFANRQFGLSHANTLSTIVGAYKSAVTKKINQLNGVSSGSSIWQRNYYEHIIRNEKSLEEIREYIIYNPLNWEKDKLFIL